MKEQGNIVSGPTDSNIIFTRNRKKSANLLQRDSQKVLYNVANNKIECQTDSCFCYKSFKFCSHTVAIAVHLKKSYISKVKRSSRNDFVDNWWRLVEILMLPRKKPNPRKKGRGKQTKNPKKLWNMLIRAAFMVVQFDSLIRHCYIVTLLKFVHRIVSTCYCCAGKFYHQGYPNAPGDLIVVSEKTCFCQACNSWKDTVNSVLVMFVLILIFHVLVHLIAALPLSLFK